MPQTKTMSATPAKAKYSHTFFLPEKISSNKIYAGIHYRSRQKIKDSFALAIQASAPPPYKGTYPVHCHYHFYIAGRQLDTSNHSFMQKMTEDAMVENGVITDDDQRYVSSISYTVEKSADKANYVAVTIIPADDSLWKPFK